jgi:hypothetical protein
MRVDPTGLAGAARRIAAALPDAGRADPVHPPLGADPVSVAGAARLSAAARTLSALIGAQAVALGTCAQTLEGIGAGFAATDADNAAGLRDFGHTLAGGVPGFGPAPPPPTPVADPRPGMPGPAGVGGEAVSRVVHAGDPAGGERFTAAWSAVGAALDEGAAVLRRVTEGLPDVWDSHVSTPVAVAWLRGWRDALQQSAIRAHTLAAQSGRHAAEAAQARADIPSPAQWDALHERIIRTDAANRAARGALAPALAALYRQAGQLSDQATAGYRRYHAATAASTAPIVDDDTVAGDAVAAPSDVPGDGQAGPDLDPAADPAAAGVGPQAAADMGPQVGAEVAALMPVLLGAAGGVLGLLARGPQLLTQAAGDAAGAATSAVSQALAPAAGEPSADPTTGPAESLGDVGDPDAGLPSSPELPQTAPVSGAGAPPPPNVAVAAAAAAPRLPGAGTLPAPVTPEPGPGGMMMPMGMPLAGAGTPDAGGRGPTGRTRTLVVPMTPHSEAVTGKRGADRTARAVAAPAPSPVPASDAAAAEPVVRRNPGGPGGGP